MRAFSFPLLSLFFLNPAFSLPQGGGWLPWLPNRPGSAPCSVPPIILNGVGYPVELKIQGSLLDGETVTFSTSGEGALSAVVGGELGDYQNTTFQDQKLSTFADGGWNGWTWGAEKKVIGYAGWPTGAGSRPLVFDEDVKDPLEFQASYTCTNRGELQLELWPAVQVPETPDLSRFLLSFVVYFRDFFLLVFLLLLLLLPLHLF